MDIRVLVCGGRDFTDAWWLEEVLSGLHARAPIGVLIHGAARGADSLAQHWAIANSVEVAAFPANWEEHGRSAGPIRNKTMLDYGRPDLVIAFPGGRGTADMVRQAKKAGVPVAVDDGGFNIEWMAMVVTKGAA